MVIKAILFDIDNTLTDFMKIKHACCEAGVNAMIKAGLKTEKKKTLKILFELYDKHGIEYQMIFEKFLKKVNRKIDYHILEHGIIAYRKAFVKNIKPYPKVIPTLKKLNRNYKLAVISDAPRMKAWERLIAMKIDKYFDTVILSKPKTTSSPFKAALKKLKVKPEEAIMVGDRPERDIKGAKRLGIKTVFAKYGNPKIKKSGADYDIKRIDDLLKILK